MQPFEFKLSSSTIFVLIAVSIINTKFATSTKLAEEDIKSAFQNEKIQPDVIDTIPTRILGVNYGSDVEVRMGNILTPMEVKTQPAVSWEVDDNNKFHTLTMVDPDAPSRKNPTNKEWLHWLVVNIPSNTTSKGQVLTEYNGAQPPKGSGLHRYVILVFEQPSKITFDEKKIGTQRSKFSIRNFAKKYNFGEAIAANFYQTERH